ncbi:hypothetical protein HBI56_029280 [Parastagonospora nodorum]|uniref:Uncharacterized protein n=1 Tax=Phaeosphaeria nodorum (strain SN15 / ATCC MYA-4574 / FGSC 10173) TaxID=321614 RepID=A0A7U2EY28_PHANO|nr:hypothetical protein HBH56_016890 [Parastagonospora nodorum]QRC95140.1 hypothetical protein JI435_406890 [Parastagonospora nodorum SN15]KAH3936992.1 hypothetical protein HBH54_017580 [Parastagonospora nodorum]KAH3953678.1 hypothetical protein HBH53_029950 [Parastagonospora nodorum]KAH3969281.1 hypothetical protein HBH51_122100 [Parastagonospora nodorum]
MKFPKPASCDGEEAETPFPNVRKETRCTTQGYCFEDRVRPCRCCRTPSCIQPCHAYHRVW